MPSLTISEFNCPLIKDRVEAGNDMDVPTIFVLDDDPSTHEHRSGQVIHHYSRKVDHGYRSEVESSHV